MGAAAQRNSTKGDTQPVCEKSPDSTVATSDVKGSTREPFLVQIPNSSDFGTQQKDEGGIQWQSPEKPRLPKGPGIRGQLLGPKAAEIKPAGQMLGLREIVK